MYNPITNQGYFWHILLYSEEKDNILKNNNLKTSNTLYLYLFFINRALKCDKNSCF
jgi:hypothetical protein